MTNSSKSGVIGAAMIGLGLGMTAVGVALVIPACTNWSLSTMEQMFRKGKDSVEGAASALGEFAGKAQHRFDEAARSARQTLDEAAKTARQTTAKAAGAVESAARYVRETASAHSA